MKNVLSPMKEVSLLESSSLKIPLSLLCSSRTCRRTFAPSWVTLICQTWWPWRTPLSKQIHAATPRHPWPLRQLDPKQSQCSSTGPSNDGKRNITCLYCDKRGHVQADCRKRIRKNGKLKPLPPRKVSEVSEEKKDVHSYSLNYLGVL